MQTYSWLSLALLLSGCLISGYDERGARGEEDGARPSDSEPAHDAGVVPDIDIDAATSNALDASDTMMDARLGPADDDGGTVGMGGDVEQYCRTHDCGDIKNCSGASCTLTCGGEDYLVDAGGRGVDCTFDCAGAETCSTTCSTALACQTSCVGTTVCVNDCAVGATCDVYCGDSRCKGTCESGSNCEFFCRAQTCDDLICRAGARCLLRCGDRTSPNTNDSTCRFNVCEAGQQQRCGDGRTVVCGRPCPMR